MKLIEFIWNNILTISQKGEEAKEMIVVCRKKGDAVLNRVITDEDIRLEAYYLWEKAGCTGSSEEFWRMAEEKLKNHVLCESHN